METHSSYQNGMENKNFDELATNIESSIQKISQNVVSMKKMVNLLGTQSDSPEHRQKMHTILHYTNTLSQDTWTNILKLKEFPIPQSSSQSMIYQLQQSRLQDSYTDALNAFQAIQRDACHKEKACIDQIKASSRSGLPPPPSNHKFGNKGEQLIELTSPTQQKQSQMQLQKDALDLRLIEEQEESILRLEEDISSVNDIFKQFGELIHGQGEIVDSIEAQIEGAKIYVSQGTENLRDASRYKNKLRKCKLMMLSIPVVILICLLILIFWHSN